jgi:hypothetical protein
MTRLVRYDCFVDDASFKKLRRKAEVDGRATSVVIFVSVVVVVAEVAGAGTI